VTWIAQTLWDLLLPQQREPKPRNEVRAVPPQGRAGLSGRRRLSREVEVKQTLNHGTSMQEKYDAIVEEMKQTYGIRVRKWRKSSSGVAWTIRYIQSGKIVKLIESPYPRGPMSCAIFLHEIGHHAIGLGVYKPRCLEEYHVWMWALNTMRERGFNVTEAVERRVERSMRYAVGKAKRRGLQQLPEELRQYL
jgi:hypothetical protein